MPSHRPKDPLTRDEFDLHYWGADYASVPASTRREFYSDYRESGYSFARYKRETTQRVENPSRRPASRRKNPSPFGEDYVEKVYGDWGQYGDVRAKELVSLAKAFGATARAVSVKNSGKKVVVRFSKGSWWASVEAFNPFAKAFAVWDERRAEANRAWNRDNGPDPDTLDLVSDLFPKASRKNPSRRRPAPRRAAASRRKNPHVSAQEQLASEAAMRGLDGLWDCVDDSYGNYHPGGYDSAEEFLEMCQYSFGERPALKHRRRGGEDVYVDEDERVVLRWVPASRRAGPRRDASGRFVRRR